MPVSPFTYVYLILTISNLLFSGLAVLKLDEEKFAVFGTSTLLTYIGFMCNRYAIQSV